MSRLQKPISFDELVSLLKKNKDGNFLITFHSMGDRDAVGSALALSTYLKNSVVSTPDFITGNTRRMLSSIDRKLRISNTFPDRIDGVIILDANNTGALGAFEKHVRQLAGFTLFIDHHLISTKEKTGLIFNDEKYNSTSSIICDLLEGLDSEIGQNTALLLLNGIIADSADLQNSTAHTFMQISSLLEKAGVTYSKVMSYFREEVPAQRRYELIKDLGSASIEMAGDFLIAHGKTSGHANSIADAAIKVGADVAVFWSETGKEVSISARLRPPLDDELQLHLGKVMQDISTLIGGNGGGHPCAAGAYGPRTGNGKMAVIEAIAEIRQRMESSR